MYTHALTQEQKDAIPENRKRLKDVQRAIEDTFNIELTLPENNFIRKQLYRARIELGQAEHLLMLEIGMRRN